MFFEIDFRCATLKKVWHIYATQPFDYKPFGNLQGTGEENRIGYFGEQRDKESDYFAMGFRLYDPEIGRFLAIDPLLDVQPSQTPYHYCFNNPTSFTDPTGLYPKKEKGDKVQAWQIEIPEDNLLRSELSYWYKWHEMCFILFDLFVDECELNWSLNNYNGYGGHSEDVRLGNNGEGSFTYVNDRYNFRSNIKFRYNQGQNVSEAVSMLVRALNWQCADYLSAEHIKEYSKEYSINVDFTTSGYKLAEYFNEAGCRLSNGEKYEYIAGTSVSLWKAPPIDGVTSSTCNVPQLELNWIYVASEWLDGNVPKGYLPYFKSYSDPSFSDFISLPFDFNMTISHEFGHQYDAKFLDYSIDREGNAHMYTGWQYKANTGRYYYFKR